MAATLQRLDQQQVSELGVTIRNAGIAGAGGAGFPTYAKWERIDDVRALLVNHQESEPNYYVDKWLGRERADDLADLFNALLDSALDLVVIGAKEKDRGKWMRELESATDAKIYLPDDLPLDGDDEAGIVFAYTDDRYEYGMENVLLKIVADVVIRQDLPMDHGWIVQNTETLCAIHDTLVRNQPMTQKYVHVGGNVPHHRFLKVPIGTPVATLLEAAGLPADELPDDTVLADGGPGWCFEIDEPPEEAGVRKRTNCILVLDRETVDEHTLGSDRIDIRQAMPWTDGDHEAELSETLSPVFVNVPLISNPAYEGLVSKSRPVVEPGDQVAVNEMIAVPASDGISEAQHASIDGEVLDVTDDYIRIWSNEQRETGRSAVVEPLDRIYWTWCKECGEYVIPDATVVDPREYVCEDCQ